MRTKLLRDTEKKISSINRQVSHAFFIGEQFLIDNSPIIATSPNELTSALYASNLYKNKFNHQINQIPDLHTEYQIFVLTSSFVFLYSVFELYQESLFDLVGEIKNSDCEKIKNISLLESLFLCLNSTMPANLTEKEIDTLDYIRWRRNCLVHAEGIPSNSLINLIKKKGGNLNSFWKETLDVNYVDFSSTLIEKFHESEFIDFIRILRYLTQKIDSKVLSLVSRDALVSFTLSKFKNEYLDKINNRKKSRLEPMFSNIIQREFDIERKDLDFSKINFLEM